MQAEDLFALAIYGIPLFLIMFFFTRGKKRAHVTSTELLDENISAGLIEPASIHPVINVNRCKGCGSCVQACPEREKKVLGLVHGKAELINPTYCIGHGACKRACPFDAITLVFGTEKRGVDIPNVSPAFETNVPGIYIAGELGGMGLIRNAIIQGIEAMENICRLKTSPKADMLDVFIVGAGPAGFAATLLAMKNNKQHVTVEQDSLGGTVSHFPRGKLVMTAPVDLPLVGKVKFTETTKEKLLEFWQNVEKKTGVKINYRERVETVTQLETGFEVKTTKAVYTTHSLLLAIGRRGTPRKLGVPGEEQNKVVYRLIDPEQYKGQHVLVVGGGDSALEAATSIAEESGTTVTLSYRSEAFARAKEKNRQKVSQAEEEGRLKVLFKSTVKEITKDKVSVNYQDEVIEIPNDGIIVSAGGILPTPFLKEMGIEVETKFGTS
jgi:thioredoxin reductase/ferredoxin